MKNKKDSLGDRMKGYENIERKYLMRRQPCILRLDGKAFHSFTKGFQRPFDMILMNSMWDTAKYLCQNIQGCKVAYTQSDEITLLLTDYDELETSAWFDKNIQKMVSISAAMATLAFNNSFATYVTEYYGNARKEFGKKYKSQYYDKAIPDISHLPEPELSQATEERKALWEELRILFNKEYPLAEIYSKRCNTALFDSRVFNLPKEEVCNCFLWRQQDSTRNAIQMIGQSQFSHKQLQNKNCNQIQEMLWQEKGINFNDFPTYCKRGACIVKENYDKDGVTRSRWTIDKNIPLFSSNRLYIEQYI